MDSHEAICNSLPSINLSYSVAISKQWILNDAETIAVLAALPCILLIGLATNFAFLFAVWRVARLQTITSYYLCHLSVADLLVLVPSISAYLIQLCSSPIRPDELFLRNSIGCFSCYFLPITAYFASTGLVSLVTLERYNGICHTLQHLRFNTLGRTKKLVMMTWTLGVVFGTLCTLDYSKLVSYCFVWPDTKQFEGFPRVVGFCVPIYPDIQMFTRGLFVVVFIASIVGNIYMYVRIIQHLRQRRSGFNGSTGDKSTGELRVSKAQREMVRMLIITGAVFFTCHILSRVVVIRLLVEYMRGDGFLTTKQFGTMIIFGRLLLMINSCSNGIIYTASNGYYRSAFWEAFYRRNTVKRQASKKDALILTHTMI